MDLLLFFILFPFLAAIALLLVPRNRVRKATGYLAGTIVLAASVFLLYSSLSGPAKYFEAGPGLFNGLMLLGEVLIAAYIVYKSIALRKYAPLALAVAQTAILLYFELGMAHSEGVQYGLFIDQLSLIMALIIGVVGSLICIYAFSYMEAFHLQHKEVKDRRGLFFFVLFAFLSAMFGLVFSNSLLWIYFFWEVTTICSFVLIGYTQTEEAVNNAFSALTMNLLGSLAFMLAIFYLGTMASPALTLDAVMAGGKALVMLPVALIGFAGLTKSAQLPFSSWLVGAMVAPTPVSALLHSSTMVKAGVYILIRLAPIYEGSLPGAMLSLVGGTTFLLASGIAISQSNAKKVLAYSTIANLGLIVACAGVGSYEAIWAAVLLMIFHALAKSLMFLSVGTVEHRIGSRDIEDMEGLITRMPRTAFMMLVGIAGMFLAPFGMLISKWATLKAFIDSSPLLVGMVALGSGITVFFWSKWMGKLIADTRTHKPIEERIRRGEWVALGSLTVLTIGVCLLFPLVSSYLVEPFVLGVYGRTAQLAQDNVAIMVMMLAAILVMPLSMLYYGRERGHLPPYMSGRTTTPHDRFAGSMGVERELSLKNYYLEEFFGERKLMRIGVALCIILVAVMFVLSWSVKV